jgi:hypothetical protein
VRGELRAKGGLLPAAGCPNLKAAAGCRSPREGGLGRGSVFWGWVMVWGWDVR